MPLLDELFRSIQGQQPQRSLAFSPEQMAEFEAATRRLPAAPSGQFFQVPADSPDRQAGQLLPLKNGQPIPDMAPIMGEADGRLWLRGAKNVEITRAPIGGIDPLRVEMAPPAAVTKGVMPDGAGPMSPKSSFTTLTSLSGAPIQFRSDDAPLYLGDSRTSDWLKRSGRQFDQSGREIETDAGRKAMSALGLSGLQGSPGPGAGSSAPVDNSPEAIVRRAFAFRDQIQSETSPSITPYQHAGHIDRADQAMKMFLELTARQMAASNQADLQRLENQGRMDVAGVQSRANQFGELDKSELHIRDAVGKGLLDQQTGQAMIDTINARRQALVSPSSRSPGSKIPDGSAGVTAAPSPPASPPIASGQDIEALRHLFGTTNPQTGDFTPDMSRIGNFIGGIKPEQIPQVASAIKSGRFGKNTAALEEALYRSAGRDWQLSAGVGSGQQSSPLDNAEYRYGFQFGGDPAAGRSPQQLFQLARVPGSTAISRTWQGVPEALSGSFINKIILPDGKMIDLEDNFNPFGMVDRSKAVGEASRRLPRTAALIAELQGKGVQPPPILRPAR